jgi:hypothetical protein
VIKEFTVNQSHRVEAKGQDAFEGLSPIRRFSLSINPDGHNIATIPKLESGLIEKVSIFRCEKIDFGCPTPEIDRRSAECLPAFVDYLLHGWECPKQVLSGDRFYVRNYLDPEYAGKVYQCDKEETVRASLRVYLRHGGLDKMEGNAEDIWAAVSDSRPAERMLHLAAPNVRSLGRYLMELTRRYPDEFKVLRRDSRDGNIYGVFWAPQENEFDSVVNGVYPSR